MCEELAKGGNVFVPRQFSNPDNVDAHIYMTGEEIVRQLNVLNVKPDGLVAGVGTGGTIMGLTRRLKCENSNLSAHPLEPLNSPTLSTGYKVGKHRIQGISDEFIPSILKLDETHSVVSVDDIDSIIMAQTLSRRFGIGVGISSGANLLGCIIAKEKLGTDSTVVTVFADDNKKYLSTDYSDEHTLKPEHLSHDIILTDVIAHKYE